MTSRDPFPGDASTTGTPREPVTPVDWFRRAPNGGTVNAALPATSEPPHDLEATTT